MKTALIGAATLLGLLAASPAGASSILYTATDLGTGYQLLPDASGKDYGVAGTGGVAYAFDKAPVTAIDVRVDGGSHADDYVQYTMQDGPFRAGYVYAYRGNLIYPVYFPTGEATTGGWFIYPGTTVYTGATGHLFTPIPLSDMNIRGQIVGTSMKYQGSGTYAAFSAVGVRSHDINADASVVDNLNTYIATIPGVSLTSAVAIDDLGRIVAGGSDGHDYLLTPTALGPAATVPEPSTLTALGLVGSLLSLRSLGRKWRR